MPLSSAEYHVLKTIFADPNRMGNLELAAFTRLIYDSLQSARFTTEVLGLLGRQFWSKVPWENVSPEVKLPLLRTAMQVTADLHQIFTVEAEAEAPTEPEALAKSEEPKAEEPKAEEPKIEEKIAVVEPVLVVPNDLTDVPEGRPSGDKREKRRSP